MVLNNSGSMCVGGLGCSSANPSPAILQIVSFNPPPLAQLCFWKLRPLFPPDFVEMIDTDFSFNKHAEIGPKTQLQCILEGLQNRLFELNKVKINYLVRKETLLLCLRVFYNLVHPNNSNNH